jgi:hypothetical protein
MKKLNRKIWPVILSQKSLRTLALLGGIFGVTSVILIVMGAGFSSESRANKEETLRNQQAVIQLEKLALASGENELDFSLAENKQFASYDDVAPFIAVLENIFLPIDPAAEIIIKSREDEIFINHYADYSINAKVRGGKALLFAGVKQLHESRFITQVTSFVMDYKPTEEEGTNQFDNLQMSLRLHLK